MGARAPRQPNAAQGRDAHVRWHSCKRDHVLLRNSTNTIHTIPLVNIFANRPLDVVTFTTGRSLDSPALADAATDGNGQLRRQPRLAKTGVRGRPLPKDKRARLGSGLGLGDAVLRAAAARGHLRWWRGCSGSLRCYRGGGGNA